MTFTISDASTTTILANSTPNSLRNIEYDSSGNIIIINDRAVIAHGTNSSILSYGSDYTAARILKGSTEDVLRLDKDSLLFYDGAETTTLDTNIWTQVQTAGAMTIVLGIGRIFTAVTTASRGCMLSSNKFFPITVGSTLVYRSRVAPQQHSQNNIIELGFGISPAASVTVALTNAAIWRKDAAGHWCPIIVLSSSVEQYGSSISNTTFSSYIKSQDYAIFTVALEASRATFTITTTSGVVINEQTMEISPNIGTFTTGHMRVFERSYNTLALIGTAPQMCISETSVWMLDTKGYTFKQSQSNMFKTSAVSPTVYTQNANYVNSTIPATAAKSNTAAGYTTLGGQWKFAMAASAETDFALFAFTVPAPYSFTCTRVSISAFNTGAVNDAAVLSTIQWGLAFNSNAVSLATAAPQSPMKKAIGTHSFAASAAIGASGGPDIVWEGSEVTFSGRFLHVTCKILIGAATASQIIRGTCCIDGYFE